MKKYSFLFTFLSLSFQLWAQTNGDQGLTKVMAEARREYVRDVSYVNQFEFNDVRNDFLGRTQIHLTLNFIPEELSLDADFKEVKSVQINGKVIYSYKLRDHQIIIPAADLKLNAIIDISFVGKLFTESPGLVRFVDKVDGSVYIYSDNEPFNAYKLFPGFDQPDIKATFETTVIAPKRWQLIGNDLEDATRLQGALQVTHFPVTKKMSTYLYFVGGGDWVVWKDKWRNIPLRLMTRKSVANSLDVENIFKLTKRGFRFFTHYFKTDYNYTKYDQLFIPEWMWGGMENIGAVTLNEKYVFKSTPEKKVMDIRTKTILHELSHMWFGDLVTMGWWSDLWLNEAFARNMEEVAFQALSREKYDQIGFITDKQEPIYTDLSDETHPVAQDMKCTRDADESFDDLTYEKGASVLQQLYRNIGKRKFRKSIKRYFQKFANSNTNYNDFVQVFSEVSGQDLSQWSESWLRHQGVSKMQVNLTCEKDKIKSLSVSQTSIEEEIFLKHITHFQMVTYKKNGNLHLSRSREILIEGAETPLPEMIGKDCPDFLILNTKGDDYSVQLLNPMEINWALKNVTKIPSVESKLMVYYAIALNFNQGHLSFLEYFESALALLEEAEEEALIEELSSKGNPIFQAILNRSGDEKAEAVAKMTKLLMSKRERVMSVNLKQQFTQRILMLE